MVYHFLSNLRIDINYLELKIAFVDQCCSVIAKLKLNNFGFVIFSFVSIIFEEINLKPPP